MIRQLENREECPGVRLLTPENGDLIYAFSGRAFLENLHYLIETAKIFAQRNIGWSEEFCRALMTRGLSVNKLTGGAELDPELIDRIVDDPKKERQIPSVFLFRRECKRSGEYLGISAHRMLFIKTDLVNEKVPVLFHVLRAFEEEQRGRNRGRLSVQLALLLHRGAKFYEHKTSNPLAAFTNTKSSELQQEGRIPWDGPEEEGTLGAEVHRKVFELVRVDNTRKMDPRGVIRNDYPEPNNSFSPDDLYGQALHYWRVMTDPVEKCGLGMGPNDSVLVQYKVK